MFRRKGKLRKQYDTKLIDLIKETKDDLNNAKVIESLSDDYDLEVIANRKKAESIHFYLFREARIRKINLK